MSAKTIEAAPTLAMGDATTELVIVIKPHNLDFVEFLGTRTMLEAEGILPEDTKLPTGYDNLFWQAGQLITGSGANGRQEPGGRASSLPNATGFACA